MEKKFSCFFYGTLTFPQVLKRVLNNGRKNTEPPINIEETFPAVLKGYKRHKVIGAVYPAIVRGDDLKDETNGFLVRGLSSRDIERLDNFEGFNYKKKKVKVYIENEENPIEAMTYIWNGFLRDLEEKDWNPEDFKQQQLHRWSGGDDDFSCFFYGTLTFLQVLKRVLNNGRENTEPPINIEETFSAVLKGYKRHKVIGAAYPAIVRGDDLKDETNGVLVKGLSSRDIERLDNFEGADYKKKKVKVYIEDEENPIEAMTYIWNGSLRDLEEKDWNPEDFKKQLHKWSGDDEFSDLH